MRHAGSRFVQATRAAGLVAISGLLLAGAVPAYASEFHPYEFSFDGTGTTTGQFAELEDVVVQEQTGTVYAYDHANGVVDKFDAAGNPQNFTATGTSSLNVAAGCSGYAAYPGNESGIAVDSSTTANQGNVYIAEYGSGVCAFDSAGNFLWHLSAEVEPRAYGACGAGTDPLGRMWTGSYGAGLLEFTASGSPPSLVTITGSAGACGVAVGTSGRFYFVDINNGAVERWTVAGPQKFFTYGGRSVAIDAATEHVYIAMYSGQVDEYTPEAEHVSEIGAGTPYAQTGVGALTAAKAVAIRSSTGQVYVADKGTGKIKVYGPLGTYPDVTTGGASSLTRHSVTVSGEVVPVGETITDCHIEWGASTAYGETTSCAQSGFGVPTPVSAALTSLTPGTTYHYRVVAEDATGPNFGADGEFATPFVDGVGTGGATEITRSKATLHGLLEPNGLDAHYYFEWGTDESYGNVTPTLPGTDAGAGGGSASAATAVEGLTFATTYHYRLVASNEDGTTYGDDRAFETDGAVGGLQTTTATNVTQISATLNGELDTGGMVTHYFFEWGPTAEYVNLTSVPPGNELPGSAGSVVVSSGIEVLSSYSTYHYRLVASNELGTTYGEDESVTTSQPLLPIVSGTLASDVGPDSATLSAEINPGFGETIYRFQYGVDAEYGSRTVASESIGSDDVSHQVNAELAGLAPGTTYHYRVVAINLSGVTNGPDQTFTTQSVPKVGAVGASDVTQTSATISASINPGLSPTTYHIEYGGPDGYYGASSPESGIIGADGALHVVTTALAGLSPGTSYRFRIVATNGIGVATGESQTLTTAAAPTPPPPTLRCSAHFVPRHGKCVKKRRRRHGKPRHRHVRRRQATEG